MSVLDEVHQHVGELTTDIREDELLEEIDTSNYRGAAALMPQPEELSQEDLEAEAERKAEILMDFALVHGKAPLMYDKSTRKGVKDSIKEEFKQLLHLKPEDITILDLYRTSQDSLRTIDNEYGIEDEALQSIGETVTNYLQEAGFPDIRTPEEIEVRPADGERAGTHNFRKDRICIMGEESDGVTSDIFFPNWVHEALHKENTEILVGHDRVEEVRDGIEKYQQFSGPSKQMIRQYLHDLPAVNQDLAKGLIGTEVIPELEELPEENPYPDDHVELNHDSYEVNIVFGDVGVQAAGIIHHEDGEHKHEAIYDVPGTESRVLQKFRDGVGELPNELTSDIQETLDDIDDEYREQIDRASRLTEQTISEYGLQEFDHRDETLTHFAQFFANQYRLDNISHKEEYYNQKETYSENAGTKIKEDLLEWVDALKQMNGTTDERFQKLMTPENRETYLKTGEIISYSDL